MSLEMDVSTNCPYMSQEERLNSLKELKKLPQPIRQKIARAGFYRLCDLTLQCMYCDCNLGIADLSENFDPWAVHALMSPRCIHVISCKGRQYVNHLMGADSGVTYEEYQTCGYHLNQVTPSNVEVKVNQHKVMGDGNVYVTPKGVAEVPPKYPNMTAYVDRLESIMKVEIQLRSNFPSMEEMADTGLYVDDGIVKCYHCGKNFFDWRPNEDPLQRHYARAITCWHVIQTVGEDNIDDQASTVQPKAKEDFEQVLTTESVENRSSLSDSDDLPGLLAENERLNHIFVCKICLDEKMSLVFLPCGHFLCCQHCGLTFTKCPMCRNCVEGYVKANFATLK